MKIRNDVRIAAVLMAGDILAINLGFLFSYWLRFNSGLFKVFYGVPHVSSYYKVLPILTVIFIFLMRSERLYSVRSRLSIVDEFFTIVKTVTIGILIFMAATFIYREFNFSRGMLLVSWAVLILFLSGWRFLVNRMRFVLRERNGKSRNLLIIGDGSMAERLVQHISNDPHWDYNIKGIVRTENSTSGNIASAPILGSLNELSSVIDKNNINEIILTETEMPRSKIMDIIFECEKRMVEFRLVADLLGLVTSQVDMRTIDGVPLLSLKESPLAEGYNVFLKRFMDIIVSASGLIILSPVFLVIAALVKLGSPGPVFYFQKRIGEDGRRFAMIKFRTMIENAEKGVGRVWAQENDHRRTKL